MTFDDILAQVLDLLQREGRVSYRALKRRFDLDDNHREDLKDEIIAAKQSYAQCAELYRLKGELQLMHATDNATEAKPAFVMPSPWPASSGPNPWSCGQR
jgi:hypothetical protein